jgi:hypothetical protein
MKQRWTPAVHSSCASSPCGSLSDDGDMIFVGHGHGTAAPVDGCAFGTCVIPMLATGHRQLRSPPAAGRRPGRSRWPVTLPHQPAPVLAHPRQGVSPQALWAWPARTRARQPSFGHRRGAAPRHRRVGRGTRAARQAHGPEPSREAPLARRSQAQPDCRQHAGPACAHRGRHSTVPGDRPVAARGVAGGEPGAAAGPPGGNPTVVRTRTNRQRCGAWNGT